MSIAKYQQITVEIKEAIQRNELRPGEKVPSAENLRQRYGISHITAMNVYQQLVEQNYIENFPGRGYFVRKSHDLRQSPATRTIGLGIRNLWDYNESDIYFNEITYGIQQECVRGRFQWLQHFAAQILNLPAFNYNDAPALKNSFIELADKVDGFLLDERIPDDLIAEIRREVNKPMVVVNRRSALPDIDSVYPPLDTELKMALELTTRLAYDNYIFAISDIHLPGSIHEMLRRAFREFTDAAGLDPARVAVIPDCNLVPHRESMAAIRQVKKDMPAGKSLLISDIITFYQESRSAGIDGYLAAHDAWRVNRGWENVAALRMKPIEIGKLAVEILQKRISGDFSRSRMHSPPPEFSVGETL